PSCTRSSSLARSSSAASMSLPGSRTKPRRTRQPSTRPSEYPSAARGCALYENVTTGNAAPRPRSASLPPVVSTSTFAPRRCASPNDESVSSVLPEYDEQITSESRPMNEGRPYSRWIAIGTLSSSARSAAAKSPPIADPPMPASVTLRTSPYAGGSGALRAIAHASRTCFPRSLMRSSMFAGSAARIRSTDSMTLVSTRCIVLAIVDHPFAGIEHRLDLGHRSRLRIHAYERLGAGKPPEAPRPGVDEDLDAVLRVERHDAFHGVAGELARPRLVEPLHDLDLLLLVTRGIAVQITAVVEGRAREGHELGDELAGLLLRLQHEIEEEEIRDDAVALGQVHREPEATGLLTAHHRAGLLHLRADVLEAHRDLIHGDTVLLAEAVDHRRHVHRLHDGLA